MRRAVLIVEDDDIVREFLVKVLEREGHEVLTASSVEAARSVILRDPTRIISAW
jgi:DNA-binding response OmpR family regulator